MNTARDANHPLRLAAQTAFPAPKPPGIRKVYMPHCSRCNCAHLTREDAEGCWPTLK